MQKGLKLNSIEGELRAVFEGLAPPGATLEFVASVQDWARAHGLLEDSEFRQATAFPEARLIVMGGVITPSDAQSSGSILTIGPFAHDALVRDLRCYALFLLLHEIAHLWGILDERGADRRALESLNRYLLEAGEPPISA